MRIAPKLVAGSSAAPQGSTAQSSRLSFLDTLANVSSTSRQRPGGVQSGAYSASGERTDDSAQNENQGQQSSSTLCRRSLGTANSIRQGATASSSVKQGDSKLDSSKASHLPDASSDGQLIALLTRTTHSTRISPPRLRRLLHFKARRFNRNKAACSFPRRADLTAPTRFHSLNRPSNPQAGSRMRGSQGWNRASNRSAHDTHGFPDAPTSLCKRGAGEGPAPADLLAAGSAGLPGLTLASADPAATLDGGSENAAQLSTIGNGDLAQALDEASTSLTSSAAKARMVSAITSGFGNSLKPTAKMNQSTSNGSISGLNSSVGDATRSGRRERRRRGFAIA